MEKPDLTEFFTTKAQANDFYDRLSNITADLYKVDFNLEKKLQEELGVRKKDEFITLLRKNKVPLDSNDALGKFFNKIRNTVMSMPQATMVIAIEPDDKLLKSISNWFLLNLKKQVLIETEVDKSLVAGAIVKYEGRHLNASIKPMFEQTRPDISEDKRVGQSDPKNMPKNEEVR